VPVLGLVGAFAFAPDSDRRPALARNLYLPALICLCPPGGPLNRVLLTGFLPRGQQPEANYRGANRFILKRITYGSSSVSYRCARDHRASPDRGLGGCCTAMEGRPLLTRPADER